VKQVNHLRSFHLLSSELTLNPPLPSIISHLPVSSSSDVQVLSAGDAQGTLVSLETMEGVSGDIILATDVLSPSLVPLLSQVKGILAERGGVLSHLAIVARERGIPVLSGVSLLDLEPAFGKKIRLDGTKKWSFMKV
jgi:pyruvate,water dikinase